MGKSSPGRSLKPGACFGVHHIFTFLLIFGLLLIRRAGGSHILFTKAGLGIDLGSVLSKCNLVHIGIRDLAIASCITFRLARQGNHLFSLEIKGFSTAQRRIYLYQLY